MKMLEWKEALLYVKCGVTCKESSQRDDVQSTCYSLYISGKVWGEVLYPLEEEFLHRNAGIQENVCSSNNISYVVAFTLKVPVTREMS